MNTNIHISLHLVWRIVFVAAIMCFGVRGLHAVQDAIHAGSVSYIGEQREIFKTGRASAKLSLAELSGMPHFPF